MTFARTFLAVFRRDVPAVARKHKAPLSRIVKDFGTFDGTLASWPRKVDVGDSTRPELIEAETVEVRAFRKRALCLAQVNEVLRRAAIDIVKNLSTKGNPTSP